MLSNHNQIERAFYNEPTQIALRNTNKQLFVLLDTYFDPIIDAAHQEQLTKQLSENHREDLEDLLMMYHRLHRPQINKERTQENFDAMLDWYMKSVGDDHDEDYFPYCCLDVGTAGKNTHEMIVTSIDHFMEQFGQKIEDIGGPFFSMIALITDTLPNYANLTQFGLTFYVEGMHDDEVLISYALRGISTKSISCYAHFDISREEFKQFVDAMLSEEKGYAEMFLVREKVKVSSIKPR